MCSSNSHVPHSFPQSAPPLYRNSVLLARILRNLDTHSPLSFMTTVLYYSLLPHCQIHGSTALASHQPKVPCPIYGQTTEVGGWSIADHSDPAGPQGTRKAIFCQIIKWRPEVGYVGTRYEFHIQPLSSACVTVQSQRILHNCAFVVTCTEDRDWM